MVRDALKINPGILTYADKRLLPRLRNPKNVDEDLRPIRGYGIFMASDGPEPMEWGDPVIDHYHNRSAESVGFTSSQLCNALVRDCDTRGCGACLRCPSSHFKFQLFGIRAGFSPLQLSKFPPNFEKLVLGCIDANQ